MREKDVQMKFGSRIALLALAASITGCMSVQRLDARLEAIREEHSVTVKADNPLSRCYLFGYLPGLLDRIDRDLDKCPRFFKEHVGPVIIEETFADNAAVYPLPFIVAGYVNPAEKARRFPVHMKNRSLLEMAVFPSPREGELFLHEATHSFEFNMWAWQRPYWEEFRRRLDSAQSMRHAGIAAQLVSSLVPLLNLVRPPGMASFYAWTNHWEDVAETHCFLRRHNGDVEFLSSRDKALYDKSRLVAAFTMGQTLGSERPGKNFGESTDWLRN